MVQKRGGQLATVGVVATVMQMRVVVVIVVVVDVRVKVLVTGMNKLMLNEKTD